VTKTDEVFLRALKKLSLRDQKPIKSCRELFEAKALKTF
jgi:hypothetical protein